MTLKRFHIWLALIILVQRKDLHVVDMTTEGVEETIVVTAMVLEEGLTLAGKTTVCFWVGAVSMEVEISLDRAALL